MCLKKYKYTKCKKKKTSKLNYVPLKYIILEK